MSLKNTNYLQFIFIIFSFFTFNKAWAIGDPEAISMTVVPTPAYHSAPDGVYQKIVFTVRNSGTAISSPSVQMTISLSNMNFAGGTFNPAVHVIRLSGNVNFNWIFVPGQGGGSESIIGTLNGNFQEGETASFEWNTLRVINPNPTPNPPNIGANLNFNAPGTFNSNPANDQVAQLVNSVPFVPTPVILSSFIVNEENCSANLTWASASEKELDYYLIQSGNDGINFKDIAKVKGNNKASSYTYEYYNSDRGNNYFRLKMVDLNGATKYSDIRNISMNCQQRNLFTISPNPSNGVAKINLNAKPGEFLLEVLNSNGTAVSSEKINFTSESANRDISLPISTPPGVYYVKLQGNSGEKFVEKLIIIK